VLAFIRLGFLTKKNLWPGSFNVDAVPLKHRPSRLSSSVLSGRSMHCSMWFVASSVHWHAPSFQWTAPRFQALRAAGNPARSWAVGLLLVGLFWAPVAFQPWWTTHGSQAKTSLQTCCNGRLESALGWNVDVASFCFIARSIQSHGAGLHLTWGMDNQVWKGLLESAVRLVLYT
jgi:hypothetical protein